MVFAKDFHLNCKRNSNTLTITILDGSLNIFGELINIFKNFKIIFYLVSPYWFIFICLLEEKFHNNLLMPFLV